MSPSVSHRTAVSHGGTHASHNTTHMNTYLRNTITGLYYDGTAFNAPNMIVARAVNADAAAFARHFWNNVEVVWEQPTGLTLDGVTFTSAARWVRLNS